MRRAGAEYHVWRDGGKAPPGGPGGSGARAKAGRGGAEAEGVHRSQAGGLRGSLAMRTSAKAPQWGQRKCQGGGASTWARTTMTTASRVSTISRRFLAAGCIQPKLVRLWRITHAVLARRRHVLEIALHKFCRLERAFPGLLRGRIGVTKRHALSARGDDALVADGGAADVAREILDDVVAGAGRLPVRIPAFAPAGSRDLGVEVRRSGVQRRVHPVAQGRLDGGLRQQPFCRACLR